MLCSWCGDLLKLCFSHVMRSDSTLISLLQARASIRIITVHGDGGGPLLEATSARKVQSTPADNTHKRVGQYVEKEKSIAPIYR